MIRLLSVMTIRLLLPDNGRRRTSYIRPARGARSKVCSGANFSRLSSQRRSQSMASSPCPNR